MTTYNVSKMQKTECGCKIEEVKRFKTLNSARGYLEDLADKHNVSIQKKDTSIYGKDFADVTWNEFCIIDGWEYAVYED